MTLGGFALSMVEWWVMLIGAWAWQRNRTASMVILFAVALLIWSDGKHGWSP